MSPLSLLFSRLNKLYYFKFPLVGSYRFSVINLVCLDDLSWPLLGLSISFREVLELDEVLHVRPYSCAE